MLNPMHAEPRVLPVSCVTPCIRLINTRPLPHRLHVVRCQPITWHFTSSPVLALLLCFYFQSREVTKFAQVVVQSLAAQFGDGGTSQKSVNKGGTWKATGSTRPAGKHEEASNVVMLGVI